MTSHLQQETLLLHMDGELSKSGQREAAEHLQSCWSCQVEFDRLGQDIAIILDAQNELFGPSLPSPPKPWPRLEPRLEAARTRSLPFWKRPLPFAAWKFKVPVVYIATAFSLLFVGFLIWAPLTAVSAKEVLKRAMASDAARQSFTSKQVLRQRVRVKKTSRASVGERTAGLVSWKSARSTYWDLGIDPVSADLFERYKSIGLQSALPLSASAMDSWVKQAHAEPTATAEGSDIVVQVASNAEGQASGLEQVRFQVQKRDWHMDQMTLSFADATFQISEEDSSVLDSQDVPRAILAVLQPATIGAPVIGAPRSGTAKGTPANLDDLEMSVRYELHRIGADLGEGIEITPRPPDQLAVNLASASPRTKEQVAALFGTIPGIKLEFQAPPTTTNSTVIPRADQPQQAPDDRLAQYFGGVAVEENYTRSVLQTTTDVLAHWYALRELAVRWPSEKDGQLSEDAKAKLTVMLRDHTNQLQTETSGLKKDLEVLLKDLSQPASNQTAIVSGANWQHSSSSGLEAALRVDRVLRSLLTTSDAPMSLDEALPKLHQSAIDLELAIGELKGALQ